MRARLLFTVAFIVILTMVVAPLASAQEPKVFKLGGVAARTGIEQKDAIEMYFDEIGNKIGDYKIELVSVDTQADADKAARAYEEAIVRDKIQAGLNNFYSLVTADYARKIGADGHGPNAIDAVDLAKSFMGLH